ncbi:MAG: ATP-binding cassette domain-containing protein [Spirochaetaceae bacterium]|jgi:zinc transport system ATP-binding protein|nr:ATP-binding cassette domain-containing protein [Spirochaetaceae bacterium]
MNMMNTMNHLVTCEKTSFGYEGRAVVSDLNWGVQRGDYLCIVGENGSGKSTVVKGILRLIPPLAGKLVFAGELKRNDIAYLSQQTAEKKDFPAGVYEIVLSGHLGRMQFYRPFYSRKEKDDALENMKRLGIDHLKHHCFRELSGGQQRRVLLARALCASRTLLVLDEPAAGLDPLISAEVYTLLKQLNEELGLTIIMVTHDIPAAIRYANTILHLKNKQLFYGASAEYVASDIGKYFLHLDHDSGGLKKGYGGV